MGAERLFPPTLEGSRFPLSGRRGLAPGSFAVGVVGLGAAGLTQSQAGLHEF